MSKYFSFKITGEKFEIPMLYACSLCNVLSLILTNLVKTKKPIVLITSKHDKTLNYKHEYLLEIEKLLTKKSSISY